MLDAILWQHVSDLQPGRVKHIAQSVLVLESVDPPEFGTSRLIDSPSLLCTNQIRERSKHAPILRFTLFRLGRRSSFRRGGAPPDLGDRMGGVIRGWWHFAVSHPIMNPHPTVEGIAIPEIKIQRTQLQSGFCFLPVMAIGAMPVQKSDDGLSGPFAGLPVRAHVPDNYQNAPENA
jgi:hypothetical protein